MRTSVAEPCGVTDASSGASGDETSMSSGSPPSLGMVRKMPWREARPKSQSMTSRTATVPSSRMSATTS